MRTKSTGLRSSAREGEVYYTTIGRRPRYVELLTLTLKNEKVTNPPPTAATTATTTGTKDGGGGGNVGWRT